MVRVIEEADYLAHYGILRKSGRYPWGSGNNVETRSKSFLSWLQELRDAGWPEKDIADSQEMSIADVRSLNTVAKDQIKRSQIDQAWKLKDTRGMSNVAIAEKMGLPGESSVRALLTEGARTKADELTAISDMLKRQVEDKTFVDVGKGIENYMNVSPQRLDAALVMLQDEGYSLHSGIKTPQLGTGKDTTRRVLCPPGTTWGDVQRNRLLIRAPVEFSPDNGLTFKTIQDPLPLNLNRIGILWKEDGGENVDGMIYVREGVPDLSLGNTPYAQVRIQVGDGHYMKGMAIYKDDMPKGIDILYGSSKSNTGSKLDALKPLERDVDGNISKDLPFGSIIRQITQDGKVVSVMNLMGTKETSGIEGGWEEWSRTLASQMLSKQPPTLVKEQLDLTYARRKQEYDEIMALTNPVVQKKLLTDFAEATDAAAVHLKAANMPRQQTKVILPLSSIPPNQVYAPTFNNGENVVLIRYPHGGTFEIPELTVNNRNREGKSLLANAQDAIGIHKTVADKLSGADFDGDTVVIIPNPMGKIKTSPAVKELKEFNPRAAYPEYPGMKPMDARTKGFQMGNVSNLITDMTLKGAHQAEIVRAVKHSMVVIDAEKHRLNWKQSEIDHGIAALKEEYQGGKTAGAATLISRAKSPVPNQVELKARPAKQGGPFDPETGARVRVPTGRTTLNKKGEVVLREGKYKKLDMTEDAHTLSTGTPVEKTYANHSNKLKSLANQARLSSAKTPRFERSPSATKTYEKEVQSLEAKLSLAVKNAPRERQAQSIASGMVKQIKDAKPDLEKDTIKKLEWRALEEARIRMGAHKKRIEITPEEWDAIQAKAISATKLNKILQHADMTLVQAHATPRTQLLMTSAKTTQARSLLNHGATRAEVAAKLGVSVSTLDASLKV